MSRPAPAPAAWLTQLITPRRKVPASLNATIHRRNGWLAIVPSVEPELTTSEAAACTLRTLKSPVATVAFLNGTTASEDLPEVAVASAPARSLSAMVSALPATESASDRFCRTPNLPSGSPIEASASRTATTKALNCASVSAPASRR
jgi:hypothetical protein